MRVDLDLSNEVLKAAKEEADKMGMSRRKYLVKCIENWLIHHKTFPLVPWTDEKVIEFFRES